MKKPSPAEKGDHEVVDEESRRVVCCVTEFDSFQRRDYKKPPLMGEVAREA